MDDLLDAISSHSTFDPTDPQIQAENRSERVVRRSSDIIRDHQQQKEAIEWARKPDWIKAHELGITTPGIDEHGEFDKEDLNEKRH